MLVKPTYCMHQTDILGFLSGIKEDVRSIEDLLTAIRKENERAELYGQHNIPELLEVSAYQWQLEQLEMKLKAPSLIKISFTSGGAFINLEKTLEEKAEEILLGIVMHLISHGDLENSTEAKRFRLIL